MPLDPPSGGVPSVPWAPTYISCDAYGNYMYIYRPIKHKARDLKRPADMCLCSLMVLFFLSFFFRCFHFVSFSPQGTWAFIIMYIRCRSREGRLGDRTRPHTYWHQKVYSLLTCGGGPCILPCSFRSPLWIRRSGESRPMARHLFWGWWSEASPEPRSSQEEGEGVFPIVKNAGYLGTL